MQLFLWSIAACGLFDGASRAWSPPTPAEAPVYTKTVTSRAYHIDKMYASMQGPYDFDDVRLVDSDKPELLWIVGYRTTVIDDSSRSEESPEFMCHANLDFEAKDYYDRFPQAPPISGRIFTLSQGQQEIRFPEGFGIPVTSDLPITLATQVLNLTVPEPDLSVRHRVDVMYVRDAEVKGEMVPLFQGAVEGFKALGEARHYGVSPDDVDHDAMGPGCSVGQAATAGDSDDDSLGQKFTAHWVVPPGREVNRTNVTRFLNLPFDTTAHYIAVHLHPYAERLTLRDLTTDRTVYEAKVTPSKGRVGIEHVDHYASREGLMLYADHEYELVSIYNNTSGKDVDSMAVMYLYMRDREFEPPDLTKKVERAEAPPRETSM